MKYLFKIYAPVVLLVLLTFGFTPAIAQIIETFETGLPTTAPATPTVYSLSSGDWTIYRGARSGTKHGGSYAVNMSSSSTSPSYVTTPQLNTLSSISFWSRGGGASTLTISKSVNGGSFTTIATQKITSAYAYYSITVNETSNNVKIRFQNGTGTSQYLDDMTINTQPVISVPTLTVAPTAISFGSVLQNTTSQKSYSLSGGKLTPQSGSIAVAAPAGYLISTSSSGGFASALSIPYSSSTLVATTIYVNFTPSAIRDYTGAITHNGGGAPAKSVSVSGSGVTSPPLPPDGSPIGFAQNVTGGTGGTVVQATNANLKDLCRLPGKTIIEIRGAITTGMPRVLTDKTFIGIGPDAKLIGGLYLDDRANNIIFKNISFTSSSDGITIAGGKNVWVDHCTFIDCGDGSVDITKGSDNVTISWSKFIYPLRNSHAYANLIGSSDSDNFPFHVTFHHNWWSDNAIERMPSVRFGRVHIFNNYYNAPGNNYCIRTRINAEILVENNYFQNVKNPWERYVTSAGGTPGKLKATGNIFESVTWFVNPLPDDGNQSFLIPGDDAVFTPPYQYQLESGSTVKASVMAGAGSQTSSSLQRSIHESPESPSLIKSITLGQNYPNPFAGQTTIPFYLSKDGHVSLKVFDLRGRELSNLANGYLKAGNHKATFDGSGFYSGMYIYKLKTGKTSLIKTMLLSNDQ